MNWKLLRDPWMIVSLALFAVSLWLAWPLLTFRHFPHVSVRDYAAMLAMIGARAIAKAREPAGRES